MGLVLRVKNIHLLSYISLKLEHLSEHIVIGNKRGLSVYHLKFNGKINIGDSVAVWDLKCRSGGPKKLEKIVDLFQIGRVQTNSQWLLNIANLLVMWKK